MVNKVVEKWLTRLVTMVNHQSLYTTVVQKNISKIIVENSSRPQQNNDDLRKQSLIAWRLSPHLVPMFKDLAQQAYAAHLIKQPKLTSLAKFSLIFCRDVATAKGCSG
jgi:hypothetical protein